MAKRSRVAKKTETAKQLEVPEWFVRRAAIFVGLVAVRAVFQHLVVDIQHADELESVRCLLRRCSAN